MCVRRIAVFMLEIELSKPSIGDFGAIRLTLPGIKYNVPIESWKLLAVLAKQSAACRHRRLILGLRFDESATFAAVTQSGKAEERALCRRSARARLIVWLCSRMNWRLGVWNEVLLERAATESLVESPLECGDCDGLVGMGC
jgi:hypothetical protein